MTQHDMEQSLEPTGYSHKDCAHGSTRAERAKCRADRNELPEDIGRLIRTRELLEQEEQEAVAERAHKVHLRSVALEHAAKWASGEGWTGTAVQVVAAAQVFEFYLATGVQMDPEQTVDVFVSARATSDAVRAGRVPGA